MFPSVFHETCRVMVVATADGRLGGPKALMLLSSFFWGF